MRKLVPLWTAVGILLICASSVWADIEVGRIGYWHFDQCDIRDDSHHGYVGRVVGNVGCVDGIVGKALRFSGLDHYVEIPDIAVPITAFSYALWFKPEVDWASQTPRQDLLYGAATAANPRPHITFNHAGEGRIALLIRIDEVSHSDVATQTRQWTAERWYHLAFTWDGEMFRVYVNGILERAVRHVGHSNTYRGLVLGLRSRDFKHNFRGDLDEVVIYDRALSAAEVDTLAAARFRYLHAGLSPSRLIPKDIAEDTYYDYVDPKGERRSLQAWKDANAFATSPVYSAKYVNAADLGFGRHITCADNQRGSCLIDNYVMPPLDASLVGYWSFDGCDARDDSGQDQAGRLVGDVRCDDGRLGRGLHFDGQDDYVEIPQPAIPDTAFTFALWFKPNRDVDAQSPRQDLLYDASTTMRFRPHISLNYNGEGRIALLVRIDDTSYDDVVSTTSQWAADTWYHVAFTWDGDQFRIYVNGTLERTVSHAGRSTTYRGLVLGLRGRDLRHDFRGSLDEVLIYDRPLSAAEIARLSTPRAREPAATVAMERVTVAGEDLVAFFVFDAQGQRIRALELDGEGAKSVPESCFACHMGNMRPDGRPEGGQYVPFDIDALRDWPGGPGVAEQAEVFRELNRIVHRVSAGYKASILDLIELWYGGDPSTPGATFTSNIPADWFTRPEFETSNDPDEMAFFSREAGLYHTIYARYCRSCHVTQGPAANGYPTRGLSVGQSAQALHGLLRQPQTDVCDATASLRMPHAEFVDHHFRMDRLLSEAGDDTMTVRDALCHEVYDQLLADYQRWGAPVPAPKVCGETHDPASAASPQTTCDTRPKAKSAR